MAMTDKPVETVVCEIHGSFVPERGRRCPGCDEEYWEKRQREDATRESWERQEYACVPFRFRDKRLNDCSANTPAQRKVLAVASEYVYQFPAHYRDGRCLTFAGKTGTGKTTLACCMIQSLINITFFTGDKDQPGRIFRARYVTACDMIMEIRETWRTKESTADVINSFAKVDLLVLDEVGANVGTESERALLYQVMDWRYRTMRPTIVITNLDREGLARVLDERAVDRLRDHGGLICTFDWESFRK
jgi:DNA replication protein DnaC